MIHEYERQTYYYETDKMGIIHHSNYIRWFEEARIDFMTKMGYPYKRLEDEGIIIPVVSVSSEYKSMVRFGDTVIIKTKITHYDGVRLCCAYEVYDKETGALRNIGKSEHCFLNEDGTKPIILRRKNKEAHETFLKSVESD